MGSRVKVWDLPVRVFHWFLVAAFFVAYLSEDDFLGVHVWAGYAVIGLVFFRLVWGFVGNRYARFANFVCSPSRLFPYLMDTVHGKAKRYIGHNPAGAAMILLLLFNLLVTSGTGLAVYGAEQHAGPLADVVRGNGEIWEEVHEIFANLTILLVGIHFLGVVFESWRHRENLVKSMFDGYKTESAAKNCGPTDGFEEDRF